jgi:methionyl-tRNA formyltransferase
MKIIIITQDSPVYLACFLDKFLSLIFKGQHVVNSIVVLSSCVDNNFLKEVKARYDFYGFIDFCKISVYILKNKLISLFAYVFPGIGCYSIGNVMHKYKIPEYKTDSVNSGMFAEYIKDNQVDLVVSIAASEIFKKPLLNAPRKGCVNYHTSLLPKYRGRQPLFWALLNDEKEVGISVHVMNEQIDGGAIISQQHIPVDIKDSLHSLYLKTLNFGPQLLAEAMDRIDKNPQEIGNNLAGLIEWPCNSFPSKKDVELFRLKGKRFFKGF